MEGTAQVAVEKRCLVCDKPLPHKCHWRRIVCSAECKKEKQRRYDALPERKAMRLAYDKTPAGIEARRRAQERLKSARFRVIEKQCKRCGITFQTNNRGRGSKPCYCDSDDCKRERTKERNRKTALYHKGPEGKAWRLSYLQRPDVAARLREWKNSPEQKERRKAYRQLPSTKQRQNENRRKFNQSPKGKEGSRKYSEMYRRTPTARAAQQRYYQSPKGKENKRRKIRSQDQFRLRLNVMAATTLVEENQ